MKMMLSTPRTISRNVSVAKAIQVCGSVSQVIIVVRISKRSSANPPSSKYSTLSRRRPAGERGRVDRRFVRRPVIDDALVVHPHPDAVVRNRSDSS